MSPGTRGAESWWDCSDSGSDSDSGLLIDSDSGSDSDSGFDPKYEINNTLLVEWVSAVQAKKTWHFLLTLAFIPSDGRSLSKLSHAWSSHWDRQWCDGGLPNLLVLEYLCPMRHMCSHETLVLSMFFVHKQSLLRPRRRGWIHNYPNCILIGFSAQHAKNAAQNGGNHRDQHGVVNRRCHCLLNEKNKAISWGYCYYFDTSEVKCGYLIILWILVVLVSEKNCPSPSVWNCPGPSGWVSENCPNISHVYNEIHIWFSFSVSSNGVLKWYELKKNNRR